MVNIIKNEHQDHTLTMLYHYHFNLGKQVNDDIFQIQQIYKYTHNLLYIIISYHPNFADFSFNGLFLKLKRRLMFYKNTFKFKKLIFLNKSI